MSKEEKKEWKTYGNTLPSNDKECFYCTTKLWEGNRTTDHILPKSKGGILSNDNKVYCCKKCNQLKQDHSIHYMFLNPTDAVFFVGAPAALFFFENGILMP